MSVVSRNPFDLLGDDGDDSSPVQSKTAAPAKKAEPAPQRTVPGSAPRANQSAADNKGTGAARGGRYPSRGGPRNVYRDDKGPRNTGPDPSTGNVEGTEGAGGFDGERVAPPKRAHHGPDKHTKGPRDGDNVRTSGGHKSRGAGSVRGAKTPAFGGERRQFERKSGTLPDSQKKVEHGWGADEGTAELSAEVEGEKDAQAEENAPQTPAGEEATEETAAAEEPAADAEPEEIQKTYEQYLAEKAEAALAFGKKEARTVNAETLEGKAFVREGIDDFFSGKEKAATKAKTAKKEKVYIEVDGQFAAPAGSRPPRTENTRGGRGEGRGGRGSGRGRGEGRGRGAPRGGRGGFGGSARSGQTANFVGSDDKAFPALGA